jgi:hypothetical protein
VPAANTSCHEPTDFSFFPRRWSRRQGNISYSPVTVMPFPLPNSCCCVCVDGRGRAILCQKSVPTTFSTTFVSKISRLLVRASGGVSSIGNNTVGFCCSVVDLGGFFDVDWRNFEIMLFLSPSLLWGIFYPAKVFSSSSSGICLLLLSAISPSSELSLSNCFSAFWFNLVEYLEG